MNASALPLVRHRTNIAAPLAALLVGAAVSAGVIAIADTNEPVVQPANVVVLDAPSPPGQGVQAKNEAGVASAIALGPELRGSKASALPAPPSAGAPQPDESLPAGPRGLASGLANR
jgi:hypothetical protein